MAWVPHIRWLLLGSSLLLLAACQTGNERPVEAEEGYFTWVDESGQVRTSPIKRDQTPIVASQRSETVPPDHTEANSESGGDTGSGTDSDRTASPRAPGKSGEQSTSEYTLENYPDGDELEKSGYIRPGDPLPYFTWRDTDGSFRVSYYRPDTRSDVEKGLVRQPVQLTPAEVYGPARDSLAESEAPARPAPNAFDVLGIESSGPSVFDQWQSSCCQNLLVSEPAEWSSSREFELTIASDSARHPFSSGTSAYRLVRLPEPGRTPSLIIRIRSFDMDGLFVPSAAFLDQNLEITRLVTELAATFMPESWHRHGYLEAFVPAFPSRGERWILLFTRDQDLTGRTVVETDRGPRVIDHAAVGVISLTEMQP